MNKTVLYPDGTYGPRPSDGTYYVDPQNLGRGWQWDDFLSEWVDHKGEVYKPSPKHWGLQEEKKVEKKCGCGAHLFKVDKHADYCDLYKKD